MKPKIYMFATLLLLGFSGEPLSKQSSQPMVTPCIKWDVVPGFVANKRQSERLFVHAYKWVKEEYPDVAVPCLNVRVGVPCPDATLTRGCWNLSTRTVYLHQWEPGSAAYIFQATVYSALWNLVKRDEVTEQSQRALNEDTADFLDYVEGSNE